MDINLPAMHMDAW